MENKKKDSYEIGDWILTTDDRLVRIVADDMSDLPFEMIRHGVAKEDVKQAIYNGLIDVEKDNAFDILAKRMYIFVPYNLSDIQKAIQAGHAVEQYVFHHGDTLEYYDYIVNHKTWIVLNGGTTNSRKDENGMSVGSLNQIADILHNNEIDFGCFYEPDLDDALTAVCFLCDERVFNWKQYPDIITWASTKVDFTAEMMNNPDIIDEYINFVGGQKNKVLKDLIFGKKLA